MRRQQADKAQKRQQWPSYKQQNEHKQLEQITPFGPRDNKPIRNMHMMCLIKKLEKGHTHNLHPRSADGPSSHMRSRSADAEAICARAP
jgi:hypothetical protein